MKRIVCIIVCLALLEVGIHYKNYHDNQGIKVQNLNITNIKDTIPKVALTFDDGPSALTTNKLLDGLKKRNVKATFFVLGLSISENKSLIYRMYEEGHLIGNHTYNHVDLAKTGFDDACREIEQTNKEIKDVTGVVPKYIRPPFGSWTEKLLEETDMSVVLWNVDPMDWKNQNADVVVNRVIKNVRSGDIILLHDTFQTSVDAALRIVDILQKKGYKFVTVDKLRNEKIARREHETK